MPSLVRLFVDHPLAPGEAVALPPQAGHYLQGVMRLGAGDRLLLINGRDGEWEAELETAGRRGAAARVLALTRPFEPPPDLWLLFAPIRKARTDFVVEKAAELGCRRILPVLTERTRGERVNAARLRLHAIEAAEQCGNTFVPEVAEAQPLAGLLGVWEVGRTLWFCDAALADERLEPPDRGEGPGAVLVGPEGGFSGAERARLRALPFARPVRLGPRILRADTAAVAALALWQSLRGDWR